MKTFELKPSLDNIIKTIREDSISRNKDLFLFVDLLCSLQTSFSIALDGAWGSGKTFFVKQTKLIIDTLNGHTQGIESRLRDEISKKYYEHITNTESTVKPQLCVYYDAWDNDCDEDPIISLIYNIMMLGSKAPSFVA